MGGRGAGATWTPAATAVPGRRLRSVQRCAHEAFEIVGGAGLHDGVDESPRVAGSKAEVAERGKHLPGPIDGGRPQPLSVGRSVSVPEGEPVGSVAVNAQTARVGAAVVASALCRVRDYAA